MTRSYDEVFSPHLKSPSNSTSSESEDSDGPVEPANKKRGRPRRYQLPTTTSEQNGRGMNSQLRPKPIPATFASTNAPRNVTIAPGPTNPRTPALRNPKIPAARVPGTSAGKAHISSQIEVQVSQNSGQALRDNGRPQTTLKRKGVLKFWS